MVTRPIMYMKLPLIAAACSMVVQSNALLAQTQRYLHAPSVNTYAKHNPDGLTIISSGRFIKPVGKHLPVAQWPHGMTLSPDGKTVFIASENQGQFVKDWDTETPIIVPLLAHPKRKNNTGGAAFSKDGQTLYWSAGESGELYFLDVATGNVTDTVKLNTSLNGRKFEDSVAMDIKLSDDGGTLYCADVTNFRVAIVDIGTKSMIGSIPVGRYPYALAVAGNRVYVANIGMFEYSAIPAPRVLATGPTNPPVLNGVHSQKLPTIDKRGLTFPPFAYPSKESEEGVEVEGRKVPGIGPANTPESFSVWGIDVTDPAQPKVVARIKTGLLVGAKADQDKAVGGSAPNYLLVHGNSLYVSDGNNDMVEKIDLKTNTIVAKIRIQPSPLTAKLRGVGPSGMVISADGSKLYVAESGINAIGVIDTLAGKVIGQIPSAWYPYRLVLSPDGKKLGSICFRGFGSGPNAGKNIPKSDFLHMKGAFITLDIPNSAQLQQMTQDVLTYNGMINKIVDLPAMASAVVPTVPGKISEQIKYVIFITKENHTYDTIFDHIPGANDDPSLLKWGYHQTISGAGVPTLTDAAVMTNHNALAKQFTVSDNFYMEPEASGVGHRWLIGVQPDNFCQMTYTLGWEFKVNSTAPGRRASFGSNGSITPEDYPEAGSMWEHLDRHGIKFRNYGEGFEFAGVGEDEDEHKTGAREVINMPMPKVVYDNTCRDFPIFNMNIPDQYRAYWFQQDYTKLFLKAKNPVPSFINICICNDHGNGANPAKGIPYVASWMADNDLALGRIVDFLSHTPQWKNMAIFVTQDDSGGEPDHVDAQRSVLLCISPWAKRRNVSHRHTTIVSMHRTLYEIFGLPALNMFDGLANDFSDCFTTTPDYTPYKYVPVDSRIFDPEKVKDPNDPDYMEARKLPSIRRDDPEVEAKILKQ